MDAAGHQITEQLKSHSDSSAPFFTVQSSGWWNHHFGRCKLVWMRFNCSLYICFNLSLLLNPSPFSFLLSVTEEMTNEAMAMEDPGYRNQDSWCTRFFLRPNPSIARYIYTFIFLITSLLAWTIRDYGHKVLSELQSIHAFFFFFISLSLCSVFSAFSCYVSCRVEGMPWRSLLLGCRRRSSY